MGKEFRWIKYKTKGLLNKSYGGAYYCEPLESDRLLIIDGDVVRDGQLQSPRGRWVIDYAIRINLKYTQDLQSMKSFTYQALSKLVGIKGRAEPLTHGLRFYALAKAHDVGGTFILLKKWSVQAEELEETIQSIEDAVSAANEMLSILSESLATLRRYQGMADGEIEGAGSLPLEAEPVIARDYSYDEWPRLSYKTHDISCAHFAEGEIEQTSELRREFKAAKSRCRSGIEHIDGLLKSCGHLRICYAEGAHFLNGLRESLAEYEQQFREELDWLDEVEPKLFRYLHHERDC